MRMNIFIIFVIMIMLNFAACFNGGNEISYIQKITKLGNIVDAKIIYQYDNHENYKFYVLKVQNTENFIEKNKDYMIECDSMKGYMWDYFVDKDKYKRILDATIKRCYAGTSQKNEWHLTINTNTGELILEIIYPDYGGT